MVEYIGKDEAHEPYEFGFEGPVATPIPRFNGGRLVANFVTNQANFITRYIGQGGSRDHPTSRRQPTGHR